MSRFVIFGIWFVFIASVSSLLFFILAINPKYLNLSGFLLFYAGILGFFWSGFLLLWRYLIKRDPIRDMGRASRQAVFLSLCAVIVLFFSQTRVLSWYLLAPFGALFIFTQYILIKRG